MGERRAVHYLQQDSRVAYRGLVHIIGRSGRY